ncbi:hypothetical protein H4219_000186 [Mycoemilia scoparia]|uniref:Inositolphosphotransferase Aur1/Ipt1 domain-containing protein n=1 Tax=Mycoemilia scoparia TaxID=417184 RepID=A0A9W8A4M2_9FUNG|nr:hypothetical protein H4219_000186 [Mycoemilia scoparia]
MVDIQFSPAIMGWKRSVVRGASQATALVQRNVYIRLAVTIAFEVALIAITFCSNFLSGYIFNHFFDFKASRMAAMDNALRIIKAEKLFGMFIEQAVQKWNSDYIGGWSFWNTYYAGAHPVVTAGVLVILLVRMLYWQTFRSNWKKLRSSVDQTSPSPFRTEEERSPFHVQNPAQQYYFLRSVWILGAWIAFLGFVFIPTMPPRLLPTCDYFNNTGLNVGGCIANDFTFVDTIGRFGSLLWDWEDPSVKTLNNPYAAFPSQHSLFACWVAMVWICIWGPSSQTVTAFRRPAAFWLHFLGRWSIVLYPMLTIYCIVVTANHYIFDAFGGIAALALSYVIVSWRTSKKKEGSPSSPHPEMLPV